MIKIALIDNDFVQKLAEIKNKKSKEELVKRLFDSMDISPKMHELVYNHEFVDRNNASVFFNNGTIFVLKLDELFENKPDKEAYYRILVPELYKKATGNTLNEIRIFDITKDWKAGESLGEFHSLAACLVGGYGLFLSDDRGSKRIADIIESDYKKRINVYNREGFVKQVKSGVLNRKERKEITHKGFRNSENEE